MTGLAIMAATSSHFQGTGPSCRATFRSKNGQCYKSREPSMPPKSPTAKGLTVKAYQGDAKTLLAFNLPDRASAKNLAGFTIQCQPPGQTPFYLQNNLRFEVPANHPQVATEPATSSINAPFHKFRWLHIPGTFHGTKPPFVYICLYRDTPVLRRLPVALANRPQPERLDQGGRAAVPEEGTTTRVHPRVHAVPGLRPSFRAQGGAASARARPAVRHIEGFPGPVTRMLTGMSPRCGSPRRQETGARAASAATARSRSRRGAGSIPLLVLSRYHDQKDRPRREHAMAPQVGSRRGSTSSDG